MKTGAPETDPGAGQTADPSMLVDVPRLMTAYYTRRPDAAVPQQQVAFGTSGHRGFGFRLRLQRGPHPRDHPSHLRLPAAPGDRRTAVPRIDTHALSESAFATALEVLAANAVEVRIDDRQGYTPTPVVSRAILTFNAGRQNGLADGSW